LNLTDIIPGVPIPDVAIAIGSYDVEVSIIGACRQIAYGGYGSQ
jgi:hypothetical protein